MRKGMSSDELRGSLLVGNFSSGGELPPPGDPVTVMPMVVEIERIKLYDGNIRLVRNPKHDDIRHAIQTQGPEAAGVLAITRRPGDDLYMIAKGGNTRLQILRDCWSETREPRFRSAQCLFHPWPGETRVLADHIAENENRGEMTFIEKALALRTLKQKMEKEAGEPISLREFERRLNDPAFRFGLRVSKSQLHRLQYASDFLYPLLPDALKTGLGRGQVEQIQKLEALFSDYWKRRGSEQGSNEAFRTLFADALSQHDGTNFSVDSVRHAFEIRLAEILDRSLHTVQAGLAALEAGIEIGDEDEEPDLAAIANGSLVRRPWSERPSDDRPPSAPSSVRMTGALPTAKTEIVPATSPTSDQAAAHNIPALRTQVFEAAQRLAERHGLGTCITEAPKCGLGFWVALPERSIAANAVTAAIWWMLVGLSEQLAYLPHDGINHVVFMPAHSELKGSVTANRWDEIYARVGRGSSWIVLPHQLHITESDMDDLVLLFRTIRRLRAGASEADLWSNARG